MNRGGRIMLIAVALTACGDDPPSGPDLDPSLSVSPTTQWAGGIVHATSEAFAAAEYAILLDGDTLEATPSGGVMASGATNVDVILPNPRLTGPATLELYIDGAAVSEAIVQVVGAARRPQAVACEGLPSPRCVAQLEGNLPLSYHGAGLPSGRLLAYLSLIGDDVEAGFAVVNLNAAVPTASIVPGLEIERVSIPSGFTSSGLLAPGFSPQPGSWLLEASTVDSAVPPARWSFIPGGSPPEILSCLGDGLDVGYIVAELATGDCLVLTHAATTEVAQLTINGTTPVPGYGAIPTSWRAGCVGFRGTVGGDWITLRSLHAPGFCLNFSNDVPPAWPVFAADGSVAFASARYPDWPKGADFSPDGDTLWVVGETASGWSLDAWDPAAGQLIRELSLDGAEACWDMRVDPLAPRVYVACKFAELPPGSDEDWPSLLIYDRQAGEILAVLHTPEQSVDWPVLAPFELVHAVGAAMVHLTAVWDGTTAPTERGLQVASWDVF